jgi:hypothetical protein
MTSAFWLVDGPLASGWSEAADTMLETYFESPKMLAHLRAGPSGPYIYMDGFAAWLERSGYDHSVAVRYVRAAAHIGHFTLKQGGTLANLDLLAFSGHLRTCRSPRPKGGRRNHHTVYGVRRYREYLLAIGVGQCRDTPESQNADLAMIVEYERWLRKHRRGVSGSVGAGGSGSGCSAGGSVSVSLTEERWYSSRIAAILCSDSPTVSAMAGGTATDQPGAAHAPGHRRSSLLLPIACRTISFAQGGLFAHEFALLGAAEISLASVVIHPGGNVDPDHLIARTR